MRSDGPAARSGRCAVALLSLVIAAGAALPVLPAPVAGEAMQDFLSQLARTPAAWRPALVDSFWRDLPGGGTPVLEDSTAHFLFRGRAERVSVAGDMTAWQPSLDLQRVPGTDLWHAAAVYPLAARLDYKLVLNGGRWLLDPRNPRTCPSGFGPNSELAMPGYAPPAWLQEPAGPPCGIDTCEAFASPQLGDRRTLLVVTPPGYDPAVPRPLLLVHDGLEYVALAGLPRVLSWLARQAPALELPVCVCVPPVQRDPEYRGERQEAFGRFVVETVLPYVAARYAVDLGPGRCASLGASNGGNISLYLLAAHPERFGYALVMSPYVDQRVRDWLLARPPSSYAVYLSWGRYDIPRLIPLIEDFTARLAELGVRHEAHRYDEGHSWGLWRATLPEALRCLDTWRRP